SGEPHTRMQGSEFHTSSKIVTRLPIQLAISLPNISFKQMPFVLHATSFFGVLSNEIMHLVFLPSSPSKSSSSTSASVKVTFLPLRSAALRNRPGKSSSKLVGLRCRVGSFIMIPSPILSRSSHHRR